jgi:hypothetical protein
VNEEVDYSLACGVESGEEVFETEVELAVVSRAPQSLTTRTRPAGVFRPECAGDGTRVGTV